MTAVWPDNIWVIGCGNMGGSILQAWLDRGAPPEAVTVIDPAPSRLPEGLAARTDMPDGDSPDLVLLSVKPHMLNDVASELNVRLGPDSTLVSILAGTELAMLHQALPQSGTIVRLMPNMAVTVGKSPMIMISQDDSADLRARMNALFDPLGPPEWLDNEDQMHVATALSGSGPAFLFRFIDALARGAEDLGMAPDQAARLALAMVEGAAELAAASSYDPGTLADQVASPNGVTRKGLDVMDADERVNILLRDVLKAAMDRNIEMAEEARDAD